MKFCNLFRELAPQTKYTAWYINIISQAHCRASDRRDAKQILGYVESHHIIPKCIDITHDTQENLAYLTAREHFVCHWLLTKIFPSNIKLLYAFSTFRYSRNDSRKISSFHFERMRRAANVARLNDHGTNQKISSSLTGVKKSELHRKHLSSAFKSSKRFLTACKQNAKLASAKNLGTKRPQHSQFMKEFNETKTPSTFYHTPLGVFTHKDIGQSCPFTIHFLRKWCKENEEVISLRSITNLSTKQTNPFNYEWVGKTRKEVGFYVFTPLPKSETCNLPLI